MSTPELSAELIRKAAGIKLLLMDCDGVLTDGRLYFSESGEEMKVFDVKDGQGLALWHAAGNSSGIISGRDAGKIIEKRAAELGIEHIRVSSRDKVSDFKWMLAKTRFTAEQTAFIGDDVGDIAVMQECGFAVAVADAMSDVAANADHVTHKPGGRGAVREVIDLLLSCRQ